MDHKKIIEAKAILDEAIEIHQPTHIFGLLSGGHDSLCATHVACQERLMEDGPGPTLLDQQIEAMKFK